MDNIAVKVENVSKTFKLPHEKQLSLKGALINFGKRGYEKQVVLKDVSFEVKKGEFFGIVGRNGSGKSTLLKLIAGIYTPDKGEVKVDGIITPFIELGVGFNPELSGRENVYLNGALLGFSRTEMEAMYDDIVEFAELERFMDQKLKNYSSGMQVRLAFSIAIRINSGILILDEILAVGDEAFQKKCYQYFSKLRRTKKTVILVTHSMDSVQRFCTRAIMIEDGSIIARGNPAKIAQRYRELLADEPAQPEDEPAQDANSAAEEDKTSVPNLVGVSAKLTRKNGIVSIETTLSPHVDIEDAIVSLFLDRDTGEQAYRFSTDEKFGHAINFKKDKPITISLDIQDIFPNGTFALRVSVKSVDRAHEYALASGLAEFEVDRRIHSKSEWDIHWQPNEKFSMK